MEEKNDQNQVKPDNKIKSWIQENLRILISIVIVFAIAGGVYSYSQRNLEEKNYQEIAENIEENILSEEEILQDKSEEKEEVSQEKKQVEIQKEEKPETKQEDRASSIATSQETSESFVETAGAGDGLTHLARRSLANYLEKNPDSTLTAEHKIYIEDFLRKNVNYNKGIRIGTSVEFSKELIRNSIERSKKLNDKQLKNLHKYAVRVSSLS